MSRIESPIGFVLLTHSKPHQTLRLVTRLNMMFGDPPIVIHHDFGKCLLAETEFPANVSFVRPHVDTVWGKFSLVDATARAITLLYSSANRPDWCVFLSGDSYPTKPAAQILANLTAGGYHAHMQNVLVSRETLKTPRPLPPDPLDRFPPDWYWCRYERYCIRRITVPSIDKRLRPKKRTLKLPHVLGRRLLPFTEAFQCYAGSQWFTLSRRAAEHVIEFQETPKGIAFADYYRSVRIADESYFQTIVCNAPELRVNYYNHLYQDWSEEWLHRTGHPKRLTLSDLEVIQAMPMHFARKIDIDTDGNLLDALDQAIDSPASAVSTEKERVSL